MKKLLFIFVSLLVLVSCTKKKQDEIVVKVGVMASMDYLPLAVAEREGYFDELGIKVEIHKFFSANDRDAAFQSGNIDGTVIDYTGAILQRGGGLN